MGAGLAGPGEELARELGGADSGRELERPGGFEEPAPVARGAGTVRATPRVGESGGGTEMSAVTYWLWFPSRRPPLSGLPGRGASRHRPVPAPEGLWRPNGLATPATSEPARAPSWRKRATRVRKDGLFISAGRAWGRPRQTSSRTPTPFLAGTRSDTRNNSTERNCSRALFSHIAASLLRFRLPSYLKGRMFLSQAKAFLCTGSFPSP